MNKVADTETVVCALYHFANFPDFELSKAPLLNLMETQNLRGTLLLAKEGINGTVAGTESAINKLIDLIKADERFADLSWKFSYHTDVPFYRAKVKLKKEIVTMGVENIDPRKIVGTYVKPKDWNALIENPDVVVIDTRNEYEVEVGTFKNAINPKTTSFREFPEYVKSALDPAVTKSVAMYCTGGIRCEKSTAYLKELGFENVFHLEGGILKYLEEVPEEESLWQGECFVFDNRVTVNHQLEKGQFDQCHACRMPITDQDKKSNAYVQGQSCHHCIDTQSDKQKNRFKEREKQVRLAKKRGEEHIGSDAVKAQAKHREAKRILREKGEHDTSKR
ncbi:MAG: UPF0176 protein [Candidatus Azotimanducaceae bacterium]|jgi:UPF0176 protein